MKATTITEHCARFGPAEREHTQFYLACGPEDGPLVIFVHGWPELSWSWRHQLPALAALGFRAIAPDMRGYGRSTHYKRQEDYAQEHVVRDMLQLLDHLGRKQAIWVGHDWGSPTVWCIASHHPERTRAVASLCIPYWTADRGVDSFLPLIDRNVYPEAKFPVGQWDYIRYYEESFEDAVAAMQGNVGNTVRLLFRKGSPDVLGKPAGTAFIRRSGGWFGGAKEAPDLPRDADVLSPEDEAKFTAALTCSSFFGPSAYYVNDKRNAAYAATLLGDGALAMPVLFLHARFDSTCETLKSSLAKPMREKCRDLTEAIVDTGHWMAQEKPMEVNAHLVGWLATRVSDVWPYATAWATRS